MYLNDKKNNTNIDSELEQKHSLNFDFISNKKFKYIAIGIGGFILLCLLFLIFMPKPIEYYLVLDGKADMILYQNSVYTEPGYRAYDNRGNDLTLDVVINGIVDTSVAGDYAITYNLMDEVVTRNITVLPSANHISNLILKGEKIIYLKQGEEYIEPKWTVYDSNNSNLANDVEVTGYVDVNTVGTYKLTYSVNDSLGVYLSDSRMVIVMGITDVSVNASPLTYTNGNVTISVGVVSNYFDYILLPNGNKSYSRNTKYEVSDNGTYNFSVYDKDGSVRERSITINNIDRVPPDGSCSGYYKDGNSYVTVSATDDYTDVIKFEANSQTFSKKTVTLDREYSMISMLIYDEAGNSNVVSCPLTNKNSIQSYNYVKCRDDIIYPGTKYALTISQKEKLATMAYGEDSYSLTGLRAVVSHMANLYESKRWHGSIDSKLSFYDYISTTTWYSANTRKRKYDASRMSYIIPIIDDVLVNGRRTLPLYIDEFDLFPNDVVSPVNTKNYIQGTSKYDNIYKAKNLTFWCFSLNGKGTSGNIYGYSSNSYKNYVSK